MNYYLKINFNLNQYQDRFESITYKYDNISLDKQFLDSHEARSS